MSRLNGAGSIISNSSDMNAFIRILFENKNFLTKDQFEKMTIMLDQNTGKILKEGVRVNDLLGYGLGLEAIFNPIFKTSVYGHTGSTFGFGSAMGYIPEKKLSYFFALNTLHEKAFNELEKIVENFIFNNCF